MAWLCVGDFNEICHQYEKFGAADRPYRQMENFWEALIDCDLSEIPFNGDFFTWSNGREGWYFTKEKLDKGYGNKAWFDLFSDCIVNSLGVTSSDHKLILIQIKGELETGIRKHRPFRYEAVWDNRVECGELIQRELLCNLNPNFSLPSVMEGLQRLANKPEEVSNLFQVFFQALFSSSMPERLEDCIRVVKSVITPEMNSDLVKQISNEEVEKAVFTMNGPGSPGPDGFPAIFY
ncbi:hypothetical protein Patl1_14180 [Pistacia atlantica]|uniref:Uncharacterized protein n=1 Tax=Pistacia atlantica TaxID=434234 RepID=A0ACC1AYE6_9ROSI|nr:hypothetical protein Patl1_14180 [Pistacia atlantica]